MQYTHGYRRSNTVRTIIMAAAIWLGLMSAAEAHAYQKGNTSEVEPTPTTEVTRTPRGTSQGTRSQAADQPSDVYDVGEWEFENRSGDMLNIEFVMTEDTYPGFIEDFDPMDIAIEVGIDYIGESKNAPDGCRQFTYSTGFFPIFVAFCENDDMVMFVMTTDFDTIESVMISFMENDPYIIPAGYEEVYS